MSQILRDLISLNEACALLAVSRPTFNKYRRSMKFRETTIGRSIFFSRLELIQKVLVPEKATPGASYLIVDKCDIDELEVAPDVFDLRGVVSIDEFGAMSLLCLLKRRLKHGSSVAVLVNNSNGGRYLKSIGFFQELRRGAPHLLVNDANIKEAPLPPESILPLQMLGYRGAEKKILDHLYDALQKQGFSENICSRLGWTIGELADNAHTHAGGPCFITIVSRPAGPNEPKFLCISIGDIGDGISETLMTNPKYKFLSVRDALYLAFKSTVTRWGDDARRGNGLNDLLAIGKGNMAWVRVESNGTSLFFDFREGRDHSIKRGDASAKTVGTRFSLVLIDAEFRDVSKEEINDLIDQAMRYQI